MPRTARPLAILVLAVSGLLATGCGKSNNEGKIVGKWKIVGLPDKTSAQHRDEFSKLNTLGVYVYLDFRPDNTLTMGVGSDAPGMLQMMKAGAPGGKLEWPAKYKLKSGDAVEIYDMPKEMQGQGGGMFGSKDRAAVKISINGDNMSMTDEEGTGQLVRVQTPVGPPAGENDMAPKKN